MRLDILLSEQYWFTRNKAQQLIRAGLVSIAGKIISKPSSEVSENDSLVIQQDRRISWVSRSAEKLAGFLEQRTKNQYTVTITGANCLDVGASTGGFTQILLEYGATQVDAVDVGTNQLHENIRRDPRVTSYEQTDIRSYVSNKTYDIIVCDASFISLQEILPSILSFAHEKTNIILLYKPQFEVGRENLRKTGVPKDEKIIEKYMKEFELLLVEKHCTIIQKKKSVLQGEAGNQEWIYWIKKKEVL